MLRQFAGAIIFLSIISPETQAEETPAESILLPKVPTKRTPAESILLPKARAEGTPSEPNILPGARTQEKPVAAPLRLEIHVLSVPESIGNLLKKFQGGDPRAPVTLIGEGETQLFIQLANADPRTHFLVEPRMSFIKGDNATVLKDGAANIERGRTQTFLTDLKVKTVDGKKVIEPANTAHFLGVRAEIRVIERPNKSKILLDLKANISQLVGLTLEPKENHRIQKPRIKTISLSGRDEVDEGDTLAWISEPYNVEKRSQSRLKVLGEIPALNRFLAEGDCERESRQILILVTPITPEPPHNYIEEALNTIRKKSTEREPNQIENTKPALFAQERKYQEVDPNGAVAEKYYFLKDYQHAQKYFRRVAENTKNPPQTAEIRALL